MTYQEWLLKVKNDPPENCTYEEREKFLLNNGYVNNEGTLIKCYKCESDNLRNTNFKYDILGCNYYEKHCNNCKSLLDKWQKSNWTNQY